MLNRRNFRPGKGVITDGLLATGQLPSLFAADDKAIATSVEEKFVITHGKQKFLTPQCYYIRQGAGTKRLYSSPRNDEHWHGTFVCAGCQLPVFSSGTIFDSHTGRPGFWHPLDTAVEKSRDNSFGMMRDEIHCHRCGGHPGHVFNDRSAPGGLRYCMDGDDIVLFIPEKI